MIYDAFSKSDVAAIEFGLDGKVTVEKGLLTVVSIRIR